MAGMPVIIRGELYRTDVEVGGGPMPPGEGGSPGEPPGIWGGGSEGFPSFPIVIPPDFISPGVPAHPIVLPPTIWPSPGRPVHPIVIPPDLGIWPGGTPEHPIVIPPPTSIWPPRPVHPIVLPDDPEKPPEEMKNWDVVTYWTPKGGWAVAIVPAGEATVPAPSAAPAE